ncbi:hypothetical protein SAMN05661103_3877 [Agrobacterium sp. 719_389]|nr:hypothetical protein SAMN05661103_3877 [Agrobacterium sp. 719_389]
MISAKEKDAPKTEFVLNYARTGPSHAFDTADQHSVLALASQAPFKRKHEEADQPRQVEVFSSMAGQFADARSPPAGLSSKDRRCPRSR